MTRPFPVNRPLLFAGLLLALLLPSAAAQSGPIALAPNWPTPLSPTTPTGVPFNVTLDCAVIAQKGGSANVDVSLDKAPAWITAQAARVSFAAADCVTGAKTTLTRPGTIQLAAAADAPGLEPFSVTLSAAVTGSTEKTTAKKDDLVLGYRPGHALSPPGDQTFRVTQATYAFELAINVTANAQTMVMFEDKTVDLGSLDGLRAMTFDVANGERAITYNVLYTPPTGNWTQAKVTFRTYSHCLVGDGCDPQLASTITWTFLNEQPPSPNDAGNPSDPAPGGQSPSVGGALTLALVALASLILARRR